MYRQEALNSCGEDKNDLLIGIKQQSKNITFFNIIIFSFGHDRGRGTVYSL